MGQATRRKMLDPNFGQTTKAEFLFLTEQYVFAYFGFCRDGKMAEAIGALVAIFQLIEYAPQFKRPVVIDTDEKTWFTGDDAQVRLDSAGVSTEKGKLWTVENGKYFPMDVHGYIEKGVQSDPISLSKLKLAPFVAQKKGGF